MQFHNMHFSWTFSTSFIYVDFKTFWHQNSPFTPFSMTFLSPHVSLCVYELPWAIMRAEKSQNMASWRPRRTDGYSGRLAGLRSKRNPCFNSNLRHWDEANSEREVIWFLRVSTQMFISSKCPLTDTSRIIFDQISRHPVTQGT